MSTRNVVPRADGEGSLGTALKNWLNGFFKWLRIDQYIDFNNNITKPSYTEGRMFYDKDEHTLVMYNENSEVVHQLGTELLMRAYNDTDEDILNGKVVRIIGSNGTAFASIVLAEADIEIHARACGVTTSTISSKEYGYVAICGKVHNLDTSLYSNGTVLYLSDTIEGEFTNIKPSIAVIVGSVIKSHATEGIIYSRINELGVVGADMLKSVYDTDNNGIVDEAETVNDGTSGDINKSTASEVRDAVDKTHEHSNKTQIDLVTDGDHDVRTDNPHSVTKTQVELGNVDNKSEATIITDVKADIDIADALTKKHSASGQFNQATAGEISGLTDKATPVDADVTLIEDSASLPIANVKKKLTWTNIKATLKTYFDSIYTLANLGGITANDVKYYYAESLGESNTTSTYPTYINKLTLSIPVPVAGNYILEMICEVANSGAGGDTCILMRNSVSTLSETRISCSVSYANRGWSNHKIIQKVTLSSAETYYIDFCRQTNTAYIKNATILLRRVI